MEKEYYQVLLEFENQTIQDLLQKEINENKSDRVILDEDLNQQYADDPLTIVLLISLALEVSKSIGKETVKWFFEYLKEKLIGQKPIESNSKEIKIVIQITDKQFEFFYDLETQEHRVVEIPAK